MPLRKTRFDRLLARYLRACLLDWHGALRAWKADREWVAAFLDPFGLEIGEGSVARSDVRPAA